MRLFPADAASAHLVHAVFEWLGFFVAATLYRRHKKLRPGEGITSPVVGRVLAGGFVGGLAGSKIVAWLQEPSVLAHLVGEPSRLIAGQSVLGALLGAWIGVEIAKRRIGLRQRTGDDFVLPFAAGLAVGRVGCFLAGLHDGTYGNATALPWGVDFGDGVARHPTQLYETLFLALFVGLLRFCGPALRHQPGLTFRWFAFGYVAWRLLVDALKPVPFAYLGGLSFIQLVCVVALVCVGMELYRSHCTATAART